MSFPSRGAALVAAAVLAALAATSYLLLTRHGSHSESGPPASRPGATGGQTSATPTPSTPSTEAPAVGLKPPIRGLIDPFGLPDTASEGPVHAFVVNADWGELQPQKNGAIATGNPIDQAIQRTRDSNARGAHIVLKVRLFSGIHAPEWAKRLGGAPFTVTDPASGRGGTVGRFWTDDFGAAYAQLQAKLAALYDSDPEVAEITVSRCTTVFDEPFLREISSPGAPQAYLAAGYTAGADERCHRQEIDAHRVWRRTRSGLAFNPFQSIAADGKAGIDEAFTEQMMAYCRTTIGPRCVLENNSVRWPPLAGRYASMYANMQRLGGPISFQTAAAGRVGDPVQTIVWAAGFGADAVELGAGTSAYTTGQLADLDAKLRANGA